MCVQPVVIRKEDGPVFFNQRLGETDLVSRGLVGAPAVQCCLRADTPFSYSSPLGRLVHG